MNRRNDSAKKWSDKFRKKLKKEAAKDKPVSKYGLSKGYDGGKRNLS